MKKALLAFFLLTIWPEEEPLIAQNLTWRPEAPGEGQTIAFTYSPQGTPLESAVTIEAVAFLLEDDLPVAKEVRLTQTPEGYAGSFLPAPGTKALFLGFTDGKGLIDHNQGNGYTQKIYSDGGIPVPGALANLAMLHAAYGYLFGISSDREKAMQYMKEEFGTHPVSKANAKYFEQYARLAAQTGDQEAVREVTARIESLSAGRSAKEKDLWTAYALSGLIDDRERSEALAARMRKKFPKGILVKDELANRFYREGNVENREDLLLKYKKFAGKEDRETLEHMALTIAQEYGSGTWKKFDHYAAMVSSPNARADLFNDVAWSFSELFQWVDESDLIKALELSERSLTLLDEGTKDLREKPSFFTQKRWQRSQAEKRGRYAQTYAALQFRLGHYQEAADYQKYFIETHGYGDVSANEQYIHFLEKANRQEDAIDVLEAMIVNNQASDALKDKYKRLIAATQNSALTAEKKLAELENEARQEIRDELRKHILDEPAPAFTLKDLNGREVALTDLQGKVVVLDFWATWCGPCKASFRGMQEAVEKFRENDEVAFLFINTWEHSEDKEKNAGEFIAINGYSFQVLLDKEDKVVESYRVDSIPTKYIIDGRGHIRFKHVGFHGDNDQLVDELTLMIEMAGNK